MKRITTVVLFAFSSTIFPMQENKQKWDGEYYEKNSSPQYTAAVKLVDTLNLSQYLSIVEIGCGSGAVSAAIARKAPGARVFGVDISESQISAACKKYDRDNLMFIVADAQNELPVPQKIGLAFSSATLLWIQNKIGLFNTIHERLKVGGDIVFKTTNKLDSSHPLNLTLMRLALNEKWKPLVRALSTQPQHYPLTHAEAIELLPLSKWQKVHVIDDPIVNFFDSKEAFARWIRGWMGGMPAVATLDAETTEALSNDFASEYVQLDGVRNAEGKILYTLPGLLIKAQKK
jgi:trans-aconitate methyltransferase